MAKTRATRRARQTAPVTIDPPADGDELLPPGFWEDTPADLAHQAAQQAALCRAGRERLEVLTERCVRLGRQGGVSWDQLGSWLGVPGETLRRRYAGPPLGEGVNEPGRERGDRVEDDLVTRHEPAVADHA